MHVIFGKKGIFTNIDLNIVDLATLQQGFTIKGEVNSALGGSVSGAGDINADGVDDLVIGAYSTASETGAAHVVFGKKGSFSNIDLGALSLAASQQGFKITGAAVNNWLGGVVSHIGDINGDKIDDIIIGAPSSSLSGAVYVIFGRSSAFTDINLAVTSLSMTHQGFQITTDPALQLGASVSNAGDFNNDGFSDIIFRDQNAIQNVYVLFGGNHGFSDIHINALNFSSSQQGFIVSGTSSHGLLRHSISSAGDLNNDGVDYIIIGANQAISPAGVACIIFGKRSESIKDTSSGNFFIFVG